MAVRSPSRSSSLVVPLVCLLGTISCADEHEPEPHFDELQGEEAEVSAPEAYAHDYDSVRPPVHVMLAADPDAREQLGLEDSIEAVVASNTSTPLLVEVVALASALGHEDVPLVIGSYELAPGDAQEIELPISQLPLRVVGADAHVVLAARVHREGAPDTEIRSLPMHVQFEPDGTQASLEIGERRHRDVESALIEASRELNATAERVHADGNIVAVGPAPTPTHAPTNGIAVDSDPAAAPPPITNDAVCTTFRVHYDDSDANQDYLGAAGTQHIRASYAWITITTPWTFWPVFEPGELVWEGYLSATGCTPWLALANGNYVFSVGTKFSKTGLPIEVHYDNADPAIGWANGNFTANNTVKYPTTVEDTRATRVAAIIARALVTPDLNIAGAGMLRANADQDCPSLPGSACYNGQLYIGTNLEEEDITLSRHVVAHELGHAVQWRAIGGLALDYEANASDVPACRCDHVVSSNQLHCLQSRERLTEAFVEGFAHFAAAKMFNEQTQNNCSFDYYKEFRNDDGSVTAPPVRINCKTARRWMETRACVAAESGTELDWMNFLWALNTNTDGFGMPLSAFWSVMTTACAPGTCSSDTVTWPELTDAVEASPTLTDNQKLWFEIMGDIYGVNH